MTSHALRRRRTRRSRAFFAAALLPLLPATARAQPKAEALPVRPATFLVEERTVRFTVNYRDVLDAELSRRLLSGLPTVIVMRGYVFPDAAAEPVALTVKSCRIVYDLWDEVFRIELGQPGGTTSTVAVNLEGVGRICAEARRTPLVERDSLRRGERYHVRVLVEVNPVSPEMLDRIQRWVTRPSGSTAIGPGDSLFGSFVGLFVPRVGDADRRLTFRTQPFTT